MLPPKVGCKFDEIRLSIYGTLWFGLLSYLEQTRYVSFGDGKTAVATTRERLTRPAGRKTVACRGPCRMAWRTLRGRRASYVRIAAGKPKNTSSPPSPSRCPIPSLGGLTHEGDATTANDDDTTAPTPAMWQACRRGCGDVIIVGSSSLYYGS